MGALLIHTPAGTIRQEFRKEKPNEVNAMALLFDDYRGKGYCAFSGHMEQEGVAGGTVISKFDKEAEEIHMQPPVQGG